ncbi:MAG: hypothetical protein A2133_03225 [Actinobacteria bacterium RBG_16_64_13]|nr:MAG: hypothetical protein A2133_03225 [Actinobacteria bacterium RBG_16_64_13]
MARLDARLELRLDKQTYERLERHAAKGNLSVAELVRQVIAHELAGDDRSWRIQVLEQGLSLDVPIPPDPGDLVRELDAGFETPLPAAARGGGD